MYQDALCLQYVFYMGIFCLHFTFNSNIVHMNESYRTYILFVSNQCIPFENIKKLKQLTFYIICLVLLQQEISGIYCLLVLHRV